MNISTMLKLGQSFASSYYSYHMNSKPSPFSASFSVTNSCNLHCSYCDMPAKLKPELTLEQIEFIFDKLKKMGVVRLGLFGGEPLYRKDFKSILDLAIKKGFSVTLNTNLLLYNKFKDDLDGVDIFYTSLDGTPEKHQKNRGRHSFDKIVDAIRDLKKKKKNITAICVVTDPDYESANYLLDFAEKEDIQIHFQPECLDAEYSRRSTNPDLDTQNMQEFWKFLYDKKLSGAKIASSRPYLKYISTWEDFNIPAILNPQTKCAAGRGYLYIDVTGMAYPCAYTSGSVKGVNLLKEDWEDSFKKTPCTECIVGPMLEFNLLFKNPSKSLVNIVKNIQ